MTIFKEINVFSRKIGWRSSYCLLNVDAACLIDIYFCVVSQRFMTIKFRFWWGPYQKRTASMLIGISPELEMALYTLCFRALPNKICTVSLGGKEFKIKTRIELNTSSLLLRSAYFIV